MSQEINNSSGNTRRARAANKIRTLTGLGATKASSTTSTPSGFPSFRFSPENEEIHEILSSSLASLPDESGDASNLNTGNDESDEVVIPGPQSLPSSPKPGETSPIKEYIRKNWTNKWDKKSLSLDLDLRGKIKTAIEDKRKSIVSHFIPEETGLIPSSQPIPEHTGVTEGTTTVTNSTKTDTRIFTFDNSTQKVSSNITQSQPPLQQSQVLYEEMGVDFLAKMEDEESMEESLENDQLDFNNLNWICPPASCQEKWDGVLTCIEAGNSSDKSSDDDVPPPFGTKLTNFGWKLIEHTLTKYFLIILIAIILLPLNSKITAFLAFISGILCTVVITNVYSEFWTTSSSVVSFHDVSPSQNDKDLNTLSRSSSPVPAPTIENQLLSIKLSPKSQGWMLQFDGTYNPHVITFHQTDPVFIRLDSSNLYISNPSPKYRIPRRKLWNDPQFNHDIKFIKHAVYNISGAQIFIAPEKLSRRRVWNKKYPIGIRFSATAPSHAWYINRVSDATSSSPADSKSSDNGSTNSLKDLDTISASSSSGSKRKPTLSLIKGDKEFIRKDCEGKVLYLFSRTCREKEDWFRRLILASKTNQDQDQKEPTDLQDDYLNYMRNIIPNLNSCLRERNEEKDHGKINSSNSVESDDSTGAGNSSRNTPADELLDIESILTVPQSPTFLNALVGRFLYDAVRSQFWSLQMQNMIQRKLNFVKRPQFVEYLLVKDLDLGGSFPIIERASTPVIDSRGLWIDLDVNYDGKFCLTLETKINLMKLRKSPTIEEEEPAIPTPPPLPPVEDDGGDDEDTTSAMSDELVGNFYDSEAEDSGESSEEEIDVEAFYLKHPEDDNQETNQGTNGGGGAQPSKGAKFLKMVEKVATSNFVAEMKVVKNAIGRVANTPLLLTVEVKQASGTICVNIPPPPTNRIWIGFRRKPQMKLVTTPKVGERSVNLTPLTDWIQRKIHQQIQRVLVLPNMDDISIKLMEFKLPA